MATCRELAAELQEQICACRRETGWGPRLVAALTGFAHSTFWKVLKRAGLSRPARPPREPANRYEWPCPGDLLHMDVSRYAHDRIPRRSPIGIFCCRFWRDRPPVFHCSHEVRE